MRYCPLFRRRHALPTLPTLLLTLLALLLALLLAPFARDNEPWACVCYLFSLWGIEPCDSIGCVHYNEPAMRLFFRFRLVHVSLHPLPNPPGNRAVKGDDSIRRQEEQERGKGGGGTGRLRI